MGNYRLVQYQKSHSQCKFPKITECSYLIKKKFYTYAIGAYLLVLVWLIVSATTEGQAQIVVCPSKLLFHIPCPGCGVTRASLLFLHGQIGEAICLNPNVLIAMAYIVLFPAFVLIDLFYKHGFVLTVYTRLDKFVRRKCVFIPFIIFELCIWVHNIYCQI